MENIIEIQTDYNLDYKLIAVTKRNALHCITTSVPGKRGEVKHPPPKSLLP